MNNFQPGIDIHTCVFYSIRTTKQTTHIFPSKSLRQKKRKNNDTEKIHIHHNFANELGVPWHIHTSYMYDIHGFLILKQPYAINKID